MNAYVVKKEKRIEIRRHLDRSFRAEFIKDISTGLNAPRKSIPSKYFYDERGSQLFEKICSLPEYYPTRTEMSILKMSAPLIMKSFDTGDIIELGSGANWKIRMLLDAAGPSKLSALRYIPVDVSETALTEASEELLKIYPGLKVLGIVADFTVHLDAVPCERTKLIFFLGSTIGNFDENMRVKFLKLVASSMNHGDSFLVGFDMLKPRETIEAAYNDARGVTSEFNKNILHVINRELNADFKTSHFDHVAFFNREKDRIEMHLRANRNTRVSIDDLELELNIDKDETIHTENSCKFSREGVRELVSKAGLDIKNWYSDENGWYSLTELSLA
jgi:L-histidine N-alpha-methyltransferase